MRRLFVKRGRPFSALESPELKNPERELSHFRRRLMGAAALIVLGFAGLAAVFGEVLPAPLCLGVLASLIVLLLAGAVGIFSRREYVLEQ